MYFLEKRPSDTSKEETESQKRSCWEQGYSEEDEGNSEHIIDQREVIWKTDKGTYTAALKLETYDDIGIQDVSGTLFFDKKSIGKLSGTILPRPCHGSFHRLADGISKELNWIANIFCDGNGCVTDTSTNLEGDHVHRGGFFHIGKVSVDVSHKGQELGLRLVHETMSFLYGKWSFAVLKACPLNSCMQSRMGIKPMTTSYDYNGYRVGKESDGSSQEHAAKVRFGTLKICRNWARMGFQQAGRNYDEYDAWHLTASSYFGSENIHSQAVGSQSMVRVINQWKSREEIQALDIYIPAKHEPLGADRKLNALVGKYLYPPGPIERASLESTLRDVEMLITKQNASIHGSRLIFMLAANESTDVALLRAIINLATINDINASDEEGNRPLHVAAHLSNQAAIKYLVEAGASTGAKDKKENTPHAILLQKQRQKKALIPIDVESFLNSVCFLMDNVQREHLVDGWLSPRMMKIFEITADLTMSSVKDSNTEFEKFEPTSLETCYSMFFGIPRMDYVPYKIISQRNPNGLYKSFQDGWGIVWEAIASLLHKKRAPTITRVEQEIYNIKADIRKWNYFLEKGGRVVYAIDALISITRKVCVSGDDGWVYEDYKDEMEEFPNSLLDEAFDVARIKCLEIKSNNFSNHPSDPYSYPRRK